MSYLWSGFYITAVIMFMTSSCLDWEKLALANSCGGWYVGSSTGVFSRDSSTVARALLALRVRLNSVGGATALTISSLQWT